MALTAASFRVEQDLATRVVRVTLAAPPLNVLTTQLARDLAVAIERLGARPDHRVLVIAAEGKAFSAGASIEEHVLPTDCEAMLEAMAGLVRALERHPRPTVALLRGACLGGGLEVALACDLIWASDRAALGSPEIKLGVLAPFAAALLPRRVGLGRALELLLTGEAIPAERALALGLLERVYPDATFEADAGAALARLASRSGPALGTARRAVREALAAPSLDAALDLVLSRYRAEVLPLADASEGLRAFLEKRPPAWRDR